MNSCKNTTGLNAALRWASKNGYKDVVELLLQSETDVHDSNDYVLRMASYHGYLEVVKVLLQHGANDYPADGPFDTEKKAYENFDQKKYYGVPPWYRP